MVEIHSHFHAELFPVREIPCPDKRAFSFRNTGTHCRAKEFNELAAKENVHSCLMTSGFKWIFHQNDPPEAGPFDYRGDFERKKHIAVMNPNGTPYVVGNPDIPGWWGGSKSFICKGSADGQEWMKDIFVEIARPNLRAGNRRSMDRFLSWVD